MPTWWRARRCAGATSGPRATTRCARPWSPTSRPWRRWASGQEIDDDEQFGQGPHTDNSFITMLAREDTPGLAVRLPSGEWLAPPVIPGTFLVNLGNIMKRWSNDRFLSTPHGVLNDTGKDRYSIAFFFSPNVEAVIECLPSCTGADNPPRYPPAVYRDLVLDFYNANYFHRQGHAGARASGRS
ncbi:MAG: hypothetical protein DMD77_09370 [Candidatus Rokuibacteriota bacterium]|nr:MAG: hypothetical protein DMD77_09370 [Candidatus Rokubacteria bacterium]